MNLLVLAGDGIGPEITAATLAVLRIASERFALGLRIEEAPVGHAGLRALGSTIHADIVEKARKADGVILGPTSTFEFKDPARGELNPSMMLRKSLDLFANIRPARTYPGFIDGDRKSTRLNSSHLCISYAVFCLKKIKYC